LSSGVKLKLITGDCQFVNPIVLAGKLPPFPYINIESQGLKTDAPVLKLYTLHILDEPLDAAVIVAGEIFNQNAIVIPF
jgi:hypothetical protein